MNWDSAKENLFAAFGLGGIFSMVEVALDPGGWLWTAARVLALVLFIVALVMAVIAWVQRRSSGPRPRPS